MYFLTKRVRMRLDERLAFAVGSSVLLADGDFTDSNLEGTARFSDEFEREGSVARPFL